MGFKEITLAGIAEWQMCLTKPHNGHTMSQADIDIAAHCFNDVFVEDVPPEPEIPPPATCANGYRSVPEEEAIWRGYCVDEPSKFKEEPAGVAVMGTNCEAVRRFTQQMARGTFKCDVFFATDVVPQGVGGLHLGCLTSAHKAWNSPTGSPYYLGWMRPDWQFHNQDGTNAELRIGLYKADENGANLRVPTWNTGFILRPKVWIPFEMSWDRRSATELWIGFKSGAHEVDHVFEVYPGCQNLRGWKFGNMDELEEYGGTPEVRFRNIVVS